MSISSSPPGEPYLVTLGDVLAVMAARDPGPFALGTSLRMGIAGAESNVAVGVEAGSADPRLGSAGWATTNSAISSCGSFGPKGSPRSPRGIPPLPPCC